MKSANRDSVTAEARAGTGKVVGGEEGCIAGAGGGRGGGDVLERTPVGWGGGTGRVAGTGGGWLTSQPTKAGGGVLERTPRGWGGGAGRFAGAGGSCSIAAHVEE